MEIKSYAKVNLYLLVHKYNKKIGLHKLDSVLTKAGNLYDTINIYKNEKDDTSKIRYFTGSGQLIKFEDCVVKRILNLLNDFGIKTNYKIDIYKKIPIQAGLGGGSSNAAAVAKYILDENKIKPTPKLLREIVKIGSDIPFFLSKFTVARITSYGEKVKQIKLPFNIEIEIANNGIACNTKTVFDKYRSLEKKEKIKGYKQLKLLKEKNFNALRNQLQQACFIAYPEVKEFTARLNENINGNRFKLSGSGSTLFRVIE